MSEQHYRDAQKLGQKEYRACVSGGRSPCLPVLDDFISPEQVLKGTDLGIEQIPTEWIVGTKSRGRVNTFAPNFMPMLDPGSEFAQKWATLCQSVAEQGLTQPVKALEYLFTLLNERMAGRRHTVVATNLTPVQLQERYGERVASRLLDRSLCAAIQLKGKDLRRQ